MGKNTGHDHYQDFSDTVRNITADTTIHVLRFGSCVLPLRNIAYLDKARIKRSSGFAYVFLLTVAVAVGCGVGLNVRTSSGERIDSAPIVALAILILTFVYVAWILILLLRHKRYALIIQTNAGDGIRVLETRNKHQLDALVDRLSEVLHDSSNKPSFMAHVTNGEITLGDSYRVSGQVGAVGQNASTRDTTFQQ